MAANPYHALKTAGSLRKIADLPPDQQDGIRFYCRRRHRSPRPASPPIAKTIEEGSGICTFMSLLICVEEFAPTLTSYANSFSRSDTKPPDPSWHKVSTMYSPSAR